MFTSKTFQTLLGIGVLLLITVGCTGDATPAPSLPSPIPTTQAVTETSAAVVGTPTEETNKKPDPSELPGALPSATSQPPSIRPGNLEVIEPDNANWLRELMGLEGHTMAVSSVAFSPDGSQLASGSLDHTVRLWDVETGKTTGTLTGHASGVNAVSVNCFL